MALLVKSGVLHLKRARMGRTGEGGDARRVFREIVIKKFFPGCCRSSSFLSEKLLREAVLRRQRENVDTSEPVKTFKWLETISTRPPTTNSRVFVLRGNIGSPAFNQRNHRFKCIVITTRIGRLGLKTVHGIYDSFESVVFLLISHSAVSEISPIF